MRKYELGIASDYVPTWTVVDAVRELFQNALDQEVADPNNSMSYAYDSRTEVLKIRNFKSILEVQSLLLGTSSKRDDPDTIGKFGEGYKIATLVLLRLGKHVTIYNYGAKEVWKPRFVISKRYGGARVLTFFIEAIEDFSTWLADHYNGLVICVEGISRAEYDEIVSSNLHMQTELGEILRVKQGRILLDEKYAGKIFVNGLYVNTLKDCKYGYDIRPKHLTIDRDRKLVRDLDIKWLTSAMWQDSESDKIIQLAKDDCHDVEFLSYNCPTDSNIKDKALKEFQEEHGTSAIPVSTQSEVEMIRHAYVNAQPIIVSESHKVLITRSGNYQETLNKLTKITGTPKERLYDWFLRVKNLLSVDHQREFSAIYDQLKEEEDE